MDLKKLQEYFFYALVLLIPCNLAKHWPQDWSYVHGILVDYLIPTIYLTDLLILTLLSIWFVEFLNLKCKVKDLKLQFRVQNYRNFIFFVVVLLFALCNLILSENRLAALYKWLKVTELTLLIMYIKRQTFISKNIIKVLSLSVCWQSILAIGQWLKQGSVFGYWFLGEQPFNSTTLGIKKIFFLGQVKVLPMGTFPHPNVLAGFLVISLILIYNLQFIPALPRILSFTGIIYNEFSISKFLKNFSSTANLILGSIALLLTFSYPAIAAFLIIVFINLVKNRKKAAQWLYFYIIILLITAVIMIKNQGWTENYYSASSWSRRGQLNKIAFDLWLTSPFFGVGLNNFIPRMEEFGQVIADYRFLQPVHNILLLILSEAGIVGIILGICGLVKIIKPINSINSIKIKNKSLALLKLLILLVLLFLGSFDHYWLTIQQGMLVGSIVLGLFISKPKFKSS